MKRALFAILAFLVFSAAVSCRPESAANGNTPRASSADPYAGLTYHDVYDPETDFDNRFGQGSDTVIETDDAYYFLFGGYVYYYDKAADDHGVLCGKPDCVHDGITNNKDCGGFVNGWGLNLRDDRLWYAAQYRDEKNELACGLFSMKTDGSDHRRSVTLEVDRDHYPQELELHGDLLYGWSAAERVVNGAPENYFSVCCWSFETGEFKLIYERSGLRSTVIPKLFYFGRYVYICICTRGFDDPEEDAFRVHVEVTRWDSENEVLETVLPMTEELFPGSLYNIWVESEDRVYIAPSLPASALPDTEMPVYRISGGAAEKICFFEGPGAVSFLDGAIIWIDRGSGDDMMRVCMKDHEGNDIYRGEWDTGILYEHLKRGFPDGFTAILGDKSSVCFVDYSMSDDGDPKHCVLRYDLSGGEPAVSVLFAGR